MSKLITRDSHARLNGDKLVTTFPSGGLDIITEDGRTIFGISQVEPGIIRVDSGEYCRIDGKVYQDRFSIEPGTTNVFYVYKTEEQKAKA